MTRRRYRKKPDQIVCAVQIDLDVADDGVVYRKWGDEQRFRRGDWLRRHLPRNRSKSRTSSNP